MVAGSALVAVNLLVIGWTREIGAWFLDVDSEHYQTLVIWIAVVSVYLLDFAVNAGTCVSQLY
jgi:solute carrier family 45 protein 1/2/4